ncbi:MAG: sigma-54-dependent Fis family transcriptional regulator [Phycisphaerae bacterium]|nr:sigma-54-dependent Fis family transcriptional regulator [Phycisphaerae bacterium]
MADILVIDDEENLSYSIQLALRRAGHECRTTATGEAGMAECVRQVPDLALIDIQLPDTNGLELLAQIQERGLDVPVIVITAFGTVDSAVAAMKQGAMDYLQKPLSMEEVALAVDRCLENRQVRNRLDAYQQAQQRESGNIRIIGQCSAMLHVLSVADKISAVPTDPAGGLVTILLCGETGTGKEVLARYIHHHGLHPDRPFVQVNSTAIPENLFEAELFGYERGTFTDAKTAKKGLLEVADEGTLLLDEIGDMPLSTQAKLLVAIESGRFRRLGGISERVANVRVMAATNSDLERKIEEGEFRADLYFRLKVFCLELPPLRERGDDLFLLADHFIEVFSRKFRKLAPELSPETRRVMSGYHWPGNVRELANVLQRAILVYDTKVLTPATLGLDTSSPAPPEPTLASLQFDFSNGACTLALVEKQLLGSAMDAASGNISEAARLLGLTRGALRHRLEKAGLTGS